MSVYLILIYVFTAIIFFILLLAYYLGVFIKINTEIKEIGPFKLLYLDLQGTYFQIGKYFDQLLKIKLENNLLNCDSVGFYYDNPYEVVDKTKCRSTIGLIVNEVETEKIQHCLKKHKELKFIELPKTKALAATSFPFRNMLTFFVYPFKVYPKFKEAYKANLKEEFCNVSCSLEFYPRDKKNPKNFVSIDTYMPLTKEAAKYIITSYSQPEWKKGIQKKID